MKITIEEIVLRYGSHSSPESGMCVMEASAYFAGEPHGDSPECVSPSIAAFLRSWNDGTNETDRQKLKPYVLKVLNTRSTPEVEQRRGLMAADWMIRTSTPTWLALANLQESADALRALPEIKSWDDVAATQATLNKARKEAAAARDAAWDAARAAARAAAWAAAGDAGGAAWAAARAAAGDAAWDAGGAAWAAAGDAAWAAARAAAGDAAWDAAWDAGGAAWDAARAAAGDVLCRTVERLQTSAFELLDRMIAAGAQ